MFLKKKIYIEKIDKINLSKCQDNNCIQLNNKKCESCGYLFCNNHLKLMTVYNKYSGTLVPSLRCYKCSQGLHSYSSTIRDYIVLGLLLGSITTYKLYFWYYS